MKKMLMIIGALLAMPAIAQVAPTNALMGSNVNGVWTAWTSSLMSGQIRVPPLTITAKCMNGNLIVDCVSGGGGSMVYPGAGVGISTGTAWGTSLGVQGTDPKVLSAGTVSGTAASLCTDANGGATTTGCSGGSGGTPNFGSYTAYGDSITFGTDLASRLSAHPYLIGNALGVQVNDQGVAGTTAQNNDPIIFNNPTFAANTIRPLISYTIGTNNVTAGAAGNLLTAYQSDVTAQYTFLSLPTSKKTLGTSGSITYGGSWVVSPSFSVGKATNVVGATATFTLTGSTVFIGLLSGNTNTAVISLTVDGATQTAPVVNVGNGTAQTGLTAVTGLTNTAHTVVLTLTGAGTLELDWAAGFSGSSSIDSTWPIFLAGQIPDRNPTDAITPQYVTVQQAAVATVQGFGLTNLIYVTQTGTLAIPTDYNTGLHPNDHGHYLMAKNFLTALNAIPIPHPVQIQPYPGGPLGNSALGSLNVGIGGAGPSGALSSTTTGQGNTAFGYNALPLNTTGGNNTAIGANTIAVDTTGTSSTAVGAFALQHTLAFSNTAVGLQSMQADTSGSHNAAFGVNSLQNILTGANNVAIGEQAGVTATSANSTTGDSNMTFLGFQSGKSVVSATTLTNSFAIGSGAVVGASNTGVFGNSSLTTLLTGSGLLVAGGTKFTASGCTNSATLGTSLAGQFTSGTTGTCTVVITPGITAPNGFACQANDLTTNADLIIQTASTTTTATISGTTATSDIVNFSCSEY